MALNVAFFVSGSGTTMAAILRAINTGELTGVRPRLVVASKSDIGAIKLAREGGVSDKDIVLERPGPAFGERLLAECRTRDVDFVGQYGWMPLTPPELVGWYGGMMVNQHPGPLDPAAESGYDFGGKGMYGRRVMAARLLFVRAVQRDSWTLAVAHTVTPEFDRGETVGEEIVDIFPETTVDTLKQKMSAAEHKLQIRVLQTFADSTVQPIRRKAHWLVKPHEKGILDACKRQAIEQYPNG